MGKHKEQDKSTKRKRNIDESEQIEEKKKKKYPYANKKQEVAQEESSDHEDLDLIDNEEGFEFEEGVEDEFDYNSAEKKQIFDSENEDNEGEKLDIEEGEEEEEGEEVNIFDGAPKNNILGEDLLDDASTIDLKEIHDQIQDIIQILTDYKRRADPNKSRQDYMNLLKRDCHIYYGYNEDLCNLFFDLFSPKECYDFFEANENDRPVVIRTNTLKTRRKNLIQLLQARGVHLEPVGDWTNVGVVVYESSVPIGATPEYLAGYYMLQSAASLLPVIALDPKENEKILDMCSAPGGKTTHIAQLMKNTGLLIASDVSNDRLKATVANNCRLGVTNCVVSSNNGLDYPKLMKGFDRVLIDAPCSGLGIIARDRSVKGTRTLLDLTRNSLLQKKLLLAAIDSVDANSKTGGIIIYSTCSITIQENEAVVDYALKKRCVKLVDTGLTFGNPGFTKYQRFRFHPSLNLSRRYYPHVHNIDGFYVAKLKKYSNDLPEKEKHREVDDEEGEELETVDEKPKSEKIKKNKKSEKAKNVKRD